jgi:glycerophosphoryl diester phosphodiesterase
MNRVLKCSLIFLVLLLSLFAVVFIIIGSLFTTTSLFSKSNCIPPLNPIYFPHRGMTDKYQENTKEAILATLGTDKGAQMDIMMTRDDYIVMFSNDNALALTDKNVTISNSTLKELSKVTYAPREYLEVKPIALLNDTIYNLCYNDPFHAINLNIKFDLTEVNAQRLIDTIDASPCQCDSSQLLIYTSPNYSELPTLRKIANNGRCKGKLALLFEPNTYVLGEYFWMKTKMPIYYASPDIIDAHYALWQAHPEILDDLNANGYCTSVMGNTNETYVDLQVNSFKVYDLVNSTISEPVTYVPDYLYYKLYIALFVIAIFSLFLIIYLLIIVNRKEPPKPVKPVKKVITLNNII